MARRRIRKGLLEYGDAELGVLLLPEVALRTSAVCKDTWRGYNQGPKTEDRTNKTMKMKMSSMVEVVVVCLAGFFTHQLQFHIAPLFLYLCLILYIGTKFHPSFPSVRVLISTVERLHQ